MRNVVQGISKFSKFSRGTMPPDPPTSLYLHFQNAHPPPTPTHTHEKSWLRACALLCKTSCSFRLCFHLRVPAGKHLSSCHYKFYVPISVSSCISSSLAAGVRSSLAVAFARLFQSYHLSLIAFSQFSLLLLKHAVIFCRMHNYRLATADQCTRVYKITYSQLTTRL